MMTFFEIKNKAIADLVSALSANQSAHSPTELALNVLYVYQYSSICDAIHNFLEKKEKDKPVKTKEELALEPDEYDLETLFHKEAQVHDFLKEFLEKRNAKFWLLNTDVTSIYREHSPVLKDKEFVHAANTVIKDNKPVTIGYRLSTVALSAREGDAAWNPPLSMLKVPHNEKSNEFAARQIRLMLVDEELFGNNLVVNTLDCAYNNIGYVYPTHDIANLVNLIRMAGNRNVFNTYKGEIKTGKGAKNKYGKIFKLPDKETHTPPDLTEQFEWNMQNGRKCTVFAKQWNNMIISGKHDKKMYDKPFNLISIQLIDNDTDKPVYKKTLWLTLCGQRRNEINLQEAYQSYRLRFDIEFFFRFGKQKLLLDKFQTPEVKHLQNWFWIVQFSYWLLYLSRTEGEKIVRPWEKYNQKCKNQDAKEPENKTVKTPTQTQRTMQTILCEFVKNNLIPKPHNKCSGRVKGDSQTKRERFIVVKKGKKLNI